MKKVLLLFLMCISFGLTAQTNYHVTTTGSSGGDGSIGNPWDIATAFDRYHTPEPGANDTLFIHGGTYVANLHVWFGGTSSGDVTITNYNGERVIIDGNTGVDDAAIIYIQAEGGGYVTIDGLEIMDSNTNRWTNTTGSFPPYPQNKLGIQSASDNYTIRNCIIHDVHGNGVGGYGGNGLIENNIMFYNGWESTDRGHCYGIYAQNDDPAHFVKCYNNIIFKNFGAGFHMYVTNATSISNLFVKDNIAFESGTLSTNVGENIFIGGLAPLDNIEVTYNHAYFDQETTGNSFRVGYYDQPNNNILVDNNYAIGGLVNMSLRYMTNLTLTNNFLSGGDYVYGQTMSWYGDAADKNTYSINNNEYHYKGSRQDYLMGTNWTGWQSFGFDLNGIMSFSEPTGSEYFLKYYPDANWATLIVYNWDNAGTIPIDLSSVLSSGDDYEIYDVENIFGSAISSGTYTGGTVNVYTNGTTVTPVIGVSTVTNPPVHTSYKMGVFIVKSSALGSGGSAPPAPIVTLSANPLGVNEEGGVSTITATLSETTTETVNVTISATGGTASTSDYQLSSTTITIPAGSVSSYRTLTGSSDLTYEGDENVVVEITNVTGGNATEHSTPQSVNITIYDDDTEVNPEPIVTFSADPLAVNEGQSIVMTATLSEITYENVNVGLLASGGGATANVDYTFSSPIVIPAGSLTGSQNFNALVDGVTESTEYRGISVVSVTGGNAVEHSTPQTVWLTIYDGEIIPAPIVTLSINPSSVSEDGGVSTITATLSETTTSNVTVTISITGGTASASDYQLSSTSIVIPTGSLSATSTLTGSTDDVYEGNETVIVEITAVGGGNATEHSTPQIETITLEDSETIPVVTLSLDQSSIFEDTGVSDIIATLSNKTTADVSVTIAVTGGTASASDYSLSSTTIVILSDSISGKQTATSQTDIIYEGDETVIIEITAVSGGSAIEHATPQIETLTLIDNEPIPLVTLSANPLGISEEGGVSTITATLSTLTSEDVDVTIEATSNTATSADYDLSSTTITIPTESYSHYQTLTGLTDTDVEGTDTVNIAITAVSGGSAVESYIPQSTNILLIDDDVAVPDSLTLINASTGLRETPIPNIEYIAPLESQHFGIYGTVYRVYFEGANLPSYLTSGNNVSKLITFGGEMKDAVSRSAFYGRAADLRISLTGTSGKGNLYWGNVGFSVITGYVDYCK